MDVEVGLGHGAEEVLADAGRRTRLGVGYTRPPLWIVYHGGHRESCPGDLPSGRRLFILCMTKHLHGSVYLLSCVCLCVARACLTAAPAANDFARCSPPAQPNVLVLRPICLHSSFS